MNSPPPEEVPEKSLSVESALDSEFRDCFEYGKNTETIRGRGCSIFGACQICR